MEVSFVFLCMERWPSDSPALGAPEKEYAKLGCTSLSPVLLNRFFRLVLWSFPSGRPVPVSYSQIHFPSSSIAKEMSGCIEWSWWPLDVIPLQMTRCSVICLSTLSGLWRANPVALHPDFSAILIPQFWFDRLWDLRRLSAYGSVWGQRRSLRKSEESMLQCWIGWKAWFHVLFLP